MSYNISFDIATIAILAVMFVALRTVFYTSSLQSATFRKFIGMTMINAVLDIITAYTISYAAKVPDWANLSLNTLYQFSSAFTVYFAIRYVFVYLDCTKPTNVIINHLLGFSYLGLLTINTFTGIIFSFVDHKYIHGPLFFSTYIISFLVVIHAFITVIINRRIIPKTKFRIVLFFLTLPIVFSITQMLVGDVLLTAFGEAFASMIMLFSLETPDYKKLLSAMEELDIARQDAEIANNTKSDFLANMSHEIRTPINGILGMDTMILRECDDPQIVEYAENIRMSGHTLLSIINDILDLSIIESGKMELAPVNYELYSVINDCYQVIRMKADEKGLILNIANNPSLPAFLYGDEVRIRQIINNLLSNGIKYTTRGHVELSVDYSLEGTNADDELFLIIKVADTGIGIKEEDKNKLFESFSRLEQNRNRSIEGTGLGLKITKQLVSMMNGTIEFESVYSQGTTFTVKIPQKYKDAAPMGDFAKKYNDHQLRVNRNADEYVAKGRKILVVDDVKMNIIVFKGLLKGTEIEIDSAMSGKECLEKACANRYDAIFMDHLMPEMDGIETFHRLKDDTLGINKETPVIVLTANAIVGAKEMYINEGFRAYLSKPVDRTALIDTVKDLFS